jgi:hypothetical protein
MLGAHHTRFQPELSTHPDPQSKNFRRPWREASFAALKFEDARADTGKGRRELLMSAKNKAHPKDGADHRAHPRVETCNLISFQCIDARGRAVRQGMGKALDVSKNGLMLESGHPVESEYVSLMSTDPDNRLIEIVGKVAYSRRSRTGSYQTGIQFSGSSDENVRFATSLIKTFHYRRKKSANGSGAAKASIAAA